MYKKIYLGKKGDNNPMIECVRVAAPKKEDSSLSAKNNVIRSRSENILSNKNDASKIDVSKSMVPIRHTVLTLPQSLRPRPQSPNRKLPNLQASPLKVGIRGVNSMISPPPVGSIVYHQPPARASHLSPVHFHFLHSNIFIFNQFKF